VLLALGLLALALGFLYGRRHDDSRPPPQ